jgi:hypothetical protein
MTTSGRWLCIGSLVAAGLLSLFLSLFGGFGLLWSGFPQKNHSSTLLALFLPCLLAFPLFVLAVGVSRLASLGLWITALINWLSIVQLATPSANDTFLAFLKLPIVCLFSRPTILLVFLASLTQLGTRFYELTHDQKWVRWKKDNLEPAA